MKNAVWLVVCGAVFPAVCWAMWRWPEVARVAEEAAGWLMAALVACAVLVFAGVGVAVVAGTGEEEGGEEGGA